MYPNRAKVLSLVFIDIYDIHKGERKKYLMSKVFQAFPNLKVSLTIFYLPF